MGIDMLAGAARAAGPIGDREPSVLVFDSGVGGLTVLAELRRILPSARLTYVADDARFPYGSLSDQDLIARVSAVIRTMVAREAPDLVVIACHTASTLVLPVLRAEFAIPFVGTVPAVKPAAAGSLTRHIAVLATPATIRRSYTAELVERFAADCAVTLVGPPRLAALAEAALRGEAVPDAEVAEQVAPCFAELDGRRVDTIVLACTHFPLLRDAMQRIAPWPVAFVDPAPAIARRASSLLGPLPEREPAPAAAHRALFTGGRALSPALLAALGAYGLGVVEVAPVE